MTHSATHRACVSGHQGGREYVAGLGRGMPLVVLSCGCMITLLEVCRAPVLLLSPCTLGVCSRGRDACSSWGVRVFDRSWCWHRGMDGFHTFSLYLFKLGIEPAWPSGRSWQFMVDNYHLLSLDLSPPSPPFLGLSPPLALPPVPSPNPVRGVDNSWLNISNCSSGFQGRKVCWSCGFVVRLRQFIGST